MKTFFKPIFILVISVTVSCTGANNHKNLTYLGQTPPADTALLFAPGVISDDTPNRDLTISPDGSEIYYRVSDTAYKFSYIAFVKFSNGEWSTSKRASFCSDDRYKYLEPIFSPDGNRLYFVSDMPIVNGDEPKDEDIWYVSRSDNGWSSPVNLGAPVNTDGGEFFPSFTNDGDLYFTRNEKGVRISNIFKSEFKNGVFSQPVKLPEEINCGVDRFNAYVSADETFVVVPAVGIEKERRGAFYYIVFRNGDGTWSSPINMGKEFNTDIGRGWSFYISPDQKYAFFMMTTPEKNNSDIFWISTDVIKRIALTNGY
jgi:hypothetical protein